MHLGFGSPFSSGRGLKNLPHNDNLLWWLDPRRITASPVDTWPARVGTFNPTAAGSLRPTWDGTSVDYDGGDDTMSASYSTLIHPAGATKVTMAMWLRQEAAAGSHLMLTTGAYGTGIFFWSFDATLYYDWNFGTGGVTRSTAPLVVGAWQFYAATFDGSRPNGTKVRTYAGAPTVVEIMPAFCDNAITSIPASSGSAIVGGPGYDGKIGDAFLWSGVELTASELQQVVNATNY